MNTFSRFAICILLCMLAATRAYASIANVNATANPGTVPVGMTSTVVVTWNMLVVNPVPAPVTATISSTGGIFTGQPALGSNSKIISKTVLVPPQATIPVTLTEVLQIPSSITYKAHKGGLGRFPYARTFTDNGRGASSGSVTINIGSSSGGVLNLSRIELRFDTDETVRIAGQDEKITAIAKINYTGSGLLDAVWEVADPSSTPGEPVFVTLRVLRQYLGAGRNAILQSPPLPTAAIGSHIVQLRINQPTIETRLPVLNYFVNRKAASGESSARLANIQLQSPPPLARLGLETDFRWQAVEGARAYQLEIHNPAANIEDGIPPRSLETDTASRGNAQPDDPPLTGILVPADRTSARLSALGRQYLQQNSRYLWRVIAIGPNGTVLATSGMQEIHVP